MKSFVGEVLVLYLHQPHLPHTVQILFELLALNQIILYVDWRVEPIFMVQVVQYAEEDDKQFFLIIHYPFFVHGVQVYWVVILYNGLCMADGAHPVDLVVAPMKVFNGEQYEVSIVAIEIYKREDNVQIGFSLMAASFTSLWQLFVKNDPIGRVRLVEHAQCAIDPH